MSVVVTVVFEPYERGPSESKTKTYKGKTEKEVLLKISKAHSYDFEDEDEGDATTAKDVYDNIMESNGDGCDYIAAMYVGTPVVFKPTEA